MTSTWGGNRQLIVLGNVISSNSAFCSELEVENLARNTKEDQDSGDF